MEEFKEVETLWNQLLQKFNNITPKLVLSVLGDSDTFVPKAWSQTIFQTALIEAAKSSGGETWIFYRGRKAGVSAVVKEAYDTYSALESRLLSPEEDFEKTPETLSVKLIRITYTKDQGKHQDQEKYKENAFNYEYDGPEESLQKFMLSLEVYIMHQKVSVMSSQDLNLELPIPIVNILIEGDLKALEQIAASTANGVPIVVIKGSGKAADAIVDYFADSRSLKSLAALLFGIRFESKTYEYLLENLQKIKSCNWLINTFDVEAHRPVSLLQVIGEAVIKGWVYGPSQQGLSEESKARSKGQVDIKPIASLEWEKKSKGRLKRLLHQKPTDDSDHVLQSDITSATSLPLYFFFGYQVLQEKKVIVNCGHILLYEALKANRCDYVKVLIAHGVHFKMKYLARLYKQTVPCPKRKCSSIEGKCSHMMHLLWQVCGESAKQLISEKPFLQEKDNLKDDTLVAVNVSRKAKELCYTLLGYRGNDEAKKEQEKSVKKMNEEKTKVHNQNLSVGTVVLKDERKSSEKSDDHEQTNADICMDLLLWAIFAQRAEIAKLYWLQGKDHLVSSLISTAMLKKLSEMATDMKEHNLSLALNEHAEIFGRRAMALLDKMYEMEEKYAINIMDEEVTVWNITTTPIMFAHENLMYDMVAHQCAQRHMNNIWYKEGAPCVFPFFKKCCRSPSSIASSVFMMSPLTTYIVNYVLYFCMLVMYSVFVLTSVGHKNYTRDISRFFEYFTYFWGAGDLIEEVITFSLSMHKKTTTNRGVWARLKMHLNDFWNAVDIISYLLLVTALFVRHFGDQVDFTTSRRIFALSLVVMYLRFFQAFLMNRTFGPTLIMIKEMLKDLLAFVWLAIVVIIGVGLYYHANLWPDHLEMFLGNDVSRWSIWKIIYIPYWQLYGEPFSEYFEGDDLPGCSTNSTIWKSDLSIERCPQEDPTVLAVAGFYMLFSNTLLVNLVIAMFSNTFERVKTDSEKLWRFERYSVIKDFEWRVPSPFNVPVMPYRIGKLLFSWWKMRRKIGEDNDKERKYLNYKRDFLGTFQKIAATKVIDKA